MKDTKVIFEESLADEWTHDLGVAEVPLNNRPLVALGVVIFALGLVVIGRIVFLDVWRGSVYRTWAEENLNQVQRIPAPRGLIFDRFGKLLAENHPVFLGFLNVKEFLSRKELEKATLTAVTDILGVPPDELMRLVETIPPEQRAEPFLLSGNLTQSQVIGLAGTNLPTLLVEKEFERGYPDGPVFASVIGYTGVPSADDLARDKTIAGQDFIGKAGVELSYDSTLRGKMGVVVARRDARGKILETGEQHAPIIGDSIHLTVDSGFQEYFYGRLEKGLAALGRKIGVGVALNPQNGEVLALVNLPSFDDNIFNGPGHNEEKLKILASDVKPLFNRAVAGLYNPGSTIKPLVGVAALAEKVITPQKEIFSPGYLEVPNPYNPDQPTRYLDWRYQGNVNLAAAIAQSSNVYFYAVGGGAFDIRGLGINRLRVWWQKFHLGEPTGIDLPGEAKGLLPSIEWKEKTTHRSWLLGDTYNVSIGQGDLLLTPIQLLTYIGAIANGGLVYKPVINKDTPHPTVLEDLTSLSSEIQEVQKGMQRAVTDPMGTAYLLRDLPFSVAAKTGSAQVQNNAQENAFFVGYAPADNPQIAVLVLIENSREGSLNAVPIAKDVLDWYYEHRLRK